MKMIIVSVYDSKVSAYMKPFFVPAVGAGIRAFSDEVNRGGDSELSKHPEDYALYRLGEFDDQVGAFQELPHRPELLVTAVTVLQVAVDPRQLKLAN